MGVLWKKKLIGMWMGSEPKFNNRDSIILAVIIIVFMIIAYILFV